MRPKQQLKAAEHLIKLDSFSPDALQCILKAFTDKSVHVTVSAQSLSLSDESTDEVEDYKVPEYSSTDEKSPFDFIEIVPASIRQ